VEFQLTCSLRHRTCVIQPIFFALQDFQNGKVPTTLAVVQVSTQASEASGIASKAQVKLFALEATTGAPAILEIHGPLDRAAAACYFVQMQLWLEGALGVPSKER
jgi:hypothetical protein